MDQKVKWPHELKVKWTDIDVLLFLTYNAFKKDISIKIVCTLPCECGTALIHCWVLFYVQCRQQK